MPKITINEIENSVSPANDTTKGNPIAIMGVATMGDFEPKVVSTYEDFLQEYGKTIPESLPYGYIAAKECLYVGNEVLFTRLGGSTGNATSATKSDDTSTIKVTSSGRGSAYNSVIVAIDKATKTVESTTYMYFTINVVSDIADEYEVTTDLYDSISANKVLYEDEIIKVEALKSITTETSITGVQLQLEGGSDFSSENKFFDEVASACTKLQDTSIYNYQIISVPGMSEIDNGSTTDKHYIWQILADLCCNPSTSLSGKTFTSTNSKLAIIDSSKATTTYTSILDDLSFPDDTPLKQLAIFYPWYTGTSIGNVVERELPASIQYLRCFAESQADGYPCKAIAGSNTGALKRISSLKEKLGRITCNTVSDLGINALSYHRTLGYYIDGNVVYNPDATSRTYKQLSIRNTINYIKQQLDEICMQMSYKLNIDIQRTEFQGRCTSLLNTLKVAGYIYGYTISLNTSSTDYSEGKITALIKVFPTTSLEEFVINLEIVNSEDLL